MNYRYARLTILLSILAGRAFTQSDILTTLQAQSNAYRSTIMQEKVFVHTDKPFYMAGEILWCKLYCMEGAFHTPLDVSKVAYLELIDKENRPVLQGKVLLEKGEGQGSFYLPPSLNSGGYTLRAYTNWMKNFGPGSFFERPITIVNSFKRLPVRPAADSIFPGMVNSHPPAPATPGKQGAPGVAASGMAMSASMRSALTNPYFIGFFPEGGNLVNGIRSKIGFQITNAAGQGVDAQGWIVDELNDTLSGFKPWKFGIGNFLFMPMEGHKYRAVITFHDGSSLVKELPTAYDRGFVLQVNELDGGRLGVKVYAKGSSSGDVFLFVKAAGLPDITRKATLEKDSALFILDKALLSEGVNQLDLLNGSGRPVCERLYAIPPHKTLTIDATSDQEAYGLRKKVRMSIAAKGGDGQWTPASLSMAVYRQDSLQSPDGMNISSYLWLGSDLRGRIESPDYYLSDEGLHSAAAWDNLMLTHGWRRFNWYDMHDLSSLMPPEHRGQLITGRLTNNHTGAPAPGIIVFLSVPGTRFQFATARTDEAGKFVFDIKDFYGSGNILVETNTPKDSVYKIEMASPYSEQYSADRSAVFPLADSAENVLLGPALLEHSLSMQVQNVYLSDTLNKFRPPVIDSFRFFGKPDYSYKLDDYTRFTTIEEVLREYVLAINVNRWHGRLHVVMLNEPIRQFFDDNNTLVLLDGIPVLDDKIFSYDPLKVYKLDVVPRVYVSGPSSFSGIASFTTYKGDYDGLEPDPRSLLFDYDGLQPKREFYSPVYETDQQAASRLPDYRNLLYWSADIHTDGQGKKEYSFYTSDLPGKYVAVIQGLTADGQAGVRYLHFEVK